MKTKKIISMLLTICISLSTMAGLCTTASAETSGSETSWKTVYTNDGKYESGTTNQQVVFFDGATAECGNLNDDGKYRITIKENLFGQPDGHQMNLYSADSSSYAVPWKKETNSLLCTLYPEETHWKAVTENEQFDLTAVCYVDLTKKSFDYTLSSSKVDTTGTGTVTLASDSLAKIVFKTYSTSWYAYPQTWSIKIEKQVEVVNKSIYSGSGFKILDPENENGGVELSLYSGERLSGANGEKYTIIYEGKSYTGVSGYFFKLCDGETSADLWFKGGDNGYKNSYDSTAKNGKNIQINCGTANPFNVKAVVDVDFSGTTPKAAVKVYDHDLTTVLVDKTVSLTGFTGITDVLYTPWSTDVSGAMHYERPVDAKLTITKQIELKKESVYSGTGYTDRKTTPHSYSFYTKERLSGENGERYIINFVGYSLTSVTRYDFELYDGTQSVALYYKSNNKNGYDDKFDVEIPEGTNPFNVKAVIDVDFSTGKAKVKVYDHDLTTVLVNKTVDLAGLTGISDVVWKLADDGNVTYSYPYGTPSLTIYKITEDGADNVQDIELKSAKLESGSVKVDLTINAVDKAVPYAIIAAFYNGNLLVKTQIKSGTVAIGEKKESESFAPPAADYDSAYIYLWDGMSTLKPYDAPVQVSLN